MKKFIDLNFVVHPPGQDIHYTVRRYNESIHYLYFLKDKFDVEMVMHGDAGNCVIDGIKYTSFKNTGGFWSRFSSTMAYLKSLNPDYVLVQGLVFPIQVIALRKALPYAKIMVQHHGGIPFRNPLKRFLQKQADKCIDTYLFTAIDNAAPWVEAMVIGNIDKCKQALEASTPMLMPDKKESKAITGINSQKNFLWVGRLDANKDPITVLKAFAQYYENNGEGTLYMIYQTDDLLPAVKETINNHKFLNDNIKLVGKVPHAELRYWYGAADYYVSGSHYEGSGYALIESMACGCIPVVTNIPSFKAIAGQCNHARLYKPGDVEVLGNILNSLPEIVHEGVRNEIVRYFSEFLSFKAIADSVYNVCNKI